jgi:hypothetical protein
MAAAPTEEPMVPEPRFPHGMRNAAMAYASSASTDVTAYEDLPGHHLLAVRNLIAITNDESYHGSASELPPATSHGYAEWDFSDVPDPMMFQRFLDAADYWFVYSDTSSAGNYDPTLECFLVAIGDVVDGTSAAGTGEGENPRDPGTSALRSPGPGALPPCRWEARTSARSWPKHASLRQSSLRSTARYDCCAPPSLKKPPRAANAHVSWANRPASTSTLTSTSMTQTRHRARVRS